MKSLASKNTVSASRRECLGGALCAGAFFAAGTGSAIGADAPSNRVRLAIAGLREKGRGVWLLKAAAVLPGVEVAVVCDVDSRAMDFAAEEIFRRTGKRPRKEKDLRKILEDPEIDGLVAAIPDHWHAASAWMAMEAGKAIYVEKPCSFCGAEGQVLLRVQKRTGMELQMGSKYITYDCLSAVKWRPIEGIGTGCLVFGEGGAVFFHPSSRVFHYDTAGKKVAEWSDPFASEWVQSSTGASEMDLLHLGNFVDAIRAKDPSMCVAPIYEGVASTVMAHAANMAYFTGETVRLDGKTGELLTKTPEAEALWNREYEKGWEPPKA